MKHHPTNLPNSADSRALTARLADWRAFAAAAGAGLAAVSQADAAIIYTDPAVKPHAGNNGRTGFNVGGSHLELFNGTSGGGGTGQTNFATFGQGGKFFVGQSSTRAARAAINFKAGAQIGGNYQSGRGGLRAFSNFFGSDNHLGAFVTNQPGLAGFELANGDLGWVRIEVTGSNGVPTGVTAIDWAYNDVPGGAITAGQMIDAVPEPGTKALALLAAGSAGVLAWRKRRTAARTGDPAALTSPDAARILSA